MSRKFFNGIKGPSEDLDYTFDWTEELESVFPVDTISTSAWTTDGSVVKGVDSTTGAFTTVWISGGTVGEWINVVNTITTSGGRTHVKTLKLSIKDV